MRRKSTLGEGKDTSIPTNVTTIVGSAILTFKSATYYSIRNESTKARL